MKNLKDLLSVLFSIFTVKQYLKDGRLRGVSMLTQVRPLCKRIQQESNNAHARLKLLVHRPPPPHHSFSCDLSQLFLQKAMVAAGSNSLLLPISRKIPIGLPISSWTR
jgi:hypothetical protein